MTNDLIDEVRKARAARAEMLDYDPHKIAEWAKGAHSERQRKLKQGRELYCENPDAQRAVVREGDPE